MADAHTVSVTLPAEGPLGIQLEWNEETKAFTLLEFIPLPDSGKAGPVEESQAVHVGATLVEVNGEAAIGQDRDQCVQRMQTAVDGKRVFAFRNRVKKKKKKKVHKRKRHDGEGSGVSKVQTAVEVVLTRKLRPLHLEVHNMSYWYLNRQKLGVKQFWYRGVEQNKNSRWWETHLFYNGE